MSVTVKVMSAEPHPDDDSRRTHTLFTDIREVHFERKPDGTPWLTLRRSGFDLERVDDATSFQPQGNVYVMNEAGRTVSTFGVSEIPKPDGVYINGAQVTDNRIGGPIDAADLRDALGVSQEAQLIRINDANYDVIGRTGRHFVVAGNRFYTEAA